jgi:hypothetical protein
MEVIKMDAAVLSVDSSNLSSSAVGVGREELNLDDTETGTLDYVTNPAHVDNYAARGMAVRSETVGEGLKKDDTVVPFENDDDNRNTKRDMEYFGVTTSFSSDKDTSPLKLEGKSFLQAIRALQEPSFTLFRIANHIVQVVGLITLLSYFSQFPPQCCGHTAAVSTTTEVLLPICVLLVAFDLYSLIMHPHLRVQHWTISLMVHMCVNAVTICQLILGAIDGFTFLIILIGSCMSLGSYFYSVYRKHLGCCCRPKPGLVPCPETPLDTATPCVRITISVLVPMIIIVSVLIELFYYPLDNTTRTELSTTPSFLYYSFGGNGGLTWDSVVAAGGCIDYRITATTSQLVEMCSRLDDDEINADYQSMPFCCYFYPNGSEEPTPPPTPSPGILDGYAVVTEYAADTCVGAVIRVSVYLLNECFQQYKYSYDGAYIITAAYSDGNCSSLDPELNYNLLGCINGVNYSTVTGYELLPAGYYVR